MKTNIGTTVKVYEEKFVKTSFEMISNAAVGDRRMHNPQKPVNNMEKLTGIPVKIMIRNSIRPNIPMIIGLIPHSSCVSFSFR
jgi:hypothetical protein